MNYTKHTCYRTTPTVTAADVAKYILCAFPSAVLLAMFFYPAEVFPWLAKLLEAFK